MWLMLTWLFETSLIRICVKTDNDHLKHFDDLNPFGIRFGTLPTTMVMLNHLKIIE